MKNHLLLFLLSISSISYSQELMNYYIEPNGSNTVTLNTLVYDNTFASLGNTNINIDANIITVTMCYFMSSGQSITYDYQSNDINLPLGYNSYTINIELYADGDGFPPCSLENLIEIGNLNFDYPYNPTATTTIPDNVFEDYLEGLGFGDDTSYNNLVYTYRIVNLKNLFMSNILTDIYSLEGLQDFIALKYLRCSNHLISEIDVSNNLNLEWLWLENNPISQLDITNNVNLILLNIASMNLSTLDVTNNINLEILNASNNQISDIDLSQNSNLVSLSLSSNQFNNIDISNNIALETFYCGNNFLSSIDISNNTFLKQLLINQNEISEIDASNNNLLEWFFCKDNFFTELNISNLTNLRLFDCWNNQITTLDFSNNSQLEVVSVYNNNLTSVNLKNGNNSNIDNFYAIDNENLFCIEVDDPNEAPYPGWNVDDQVVFSEDCSLGITEQSLQEVIQLYPNPVKDVLQINTQSNIAIKYVKVYDVLGKQLLESKNVNQIDISAFTTGLLFVKIMTDKGVVVKRVVKE